MSLPSSSRILLCVVGLMLVPLGCARSIAAGEESPPPTCTWKEGTIIKGTSEPLIDSQLVAFTDGSGTATLLVSMESAEEGYGYFTYRIDSNLRAVTSYFTPDLFPRALREENGKLIMIALDSATADCVYREVDENGVELRRVTLSRADYDLCAPETFALGTHEIARWGSHGLEITSREDFSVSTLDLTSEGSLSSVVPDVSGDSFVGAGSMAYEAFTLRITAHEGTRVLSVPPGGPAEDRLLQRLAATPHGDLFTADVAGIFGGTRPSYVLGVHTRTGDAALPLELFLEEELYPVSTDATSSLFLTHQLAVWTYDRRNGSTDVVQLEAPSETLGPLSTTTASSARQAYIFWAHDLVLRGSVITCERP